MENLIADLQKEISKDDFIDQDIDKIINIETAIEELMTVVKTKRIIRKLKTKYPLNPYIDHIRLITRNRDDEDGTVTDEWIIEMNFPKLWIHGYIAYASRGYRLVENTIKVTRPCDDGELFDLTDIYQIYNDKMMIKDIEYFQSFVNSLFKYLFKNYQSEWSPKVDWVKLNEKNITMNKDVDREEEDEEEEEDDDSLEFFLLIEKRII
jgi:hypothetical protein